MPGFADGTRFKVISALDLGAGQHRYELQANGQTVWVLAADLRSSPPAHVADAPGFALPDRGMSMTQRMQTMTLTQRMAALGLKDDPPGTNTTQRLRILSAEDLGGVVPDIDGPVTGGPFQATKKPEDKKP